MDVVNTPIGDIEVEENKIIGRPTPTVLNKQSQKKDVTIEKVTIRNNKGMLITKHIEVYSNGRAGYRRLIKVEKSKG